MNVMSLHSFGPGRFGNFGKKIVKEWTAKDYVQSGLVAMWDGVENAGWGVHDSAATKWIDCISGYEIAIPDNSDVYTWTGSSLKRTGTGGIAQNISELNQTSNADAWTIEIGMSMTTPVVAPSGLTGYQFANFTVNNTARQMRIFSQGNLNVIVTPDANWYHTPGVSLPFSRRTFTLGKTSTETATAGRYDAFVGTNGSLMTGTRASRYALGGQMNLFAVSAWAETTEAEILFIRRYHRALTPAEIAHNYRVDKLRFGLP